MSKSGRPERHDADYFPFYCKDGKTLFILQHKFGLEGIGFFTNLMRLLTTTPDHYLCISDPGDALYFFSRIGIDEDRGLEIMEALLLTGKLHKELWEQYRVVFSPDLLSSLKPLYERRNNEIITIETIINRVSADNNTLHEGLCIQKVSSGVVSGDNNTQSKVKQSKVKNKNSAAFATGPDEQLPEPAKNPEQTQPVKTDKKQISAMKDPVAQYYQERFTATVPAESWANIAKERTHLSNLAKNTRRMLEYTPYDTETDLADAILGTYERMKQTSREKYIRDGPWTPTGLITRWDQVVETLRQEFVAEEEIIF